MRLLSVKQITYARYPKNTELFIMSVWVEHKFLGFTWCTHYLGRNEEIPGCWDWYAEYCARYKFITSSRLNEQLDEAARQYFEEKKCQKN